jgi:hypothetical protein
MNTEHMNRCTFWLTKVGTGLAGYPEEQMKALFLNSPKTSSSRKAGKGELCRKKKN